MDPYVSSEMQISLHFKQWREREKNKKKTKPKKQQPQETKSAQTGRQKVHKQGRIVFSSMVQPLLLS